MHFTAFARLAGAAVAAVVLMAVAAPAGAFCIENNTRFLEIEIAQVDGYKEPCVGFFCKRFEKRLKPGQSECCAHGNTDCNVTGRPETMIEFHARLLWGKQYVCVAGAKPASQGLKIRADQTLSIRQDGMHVRCDVR
jgi:hypothetical protein